MGCEESCSRQHHSQNKHTTIHENPPEDAKAALRFVVSVFCQARDSKEEDGGGNLGEQEQAPRRGRFVSPRLCSPCGVASTSIDRPWMASTSWPSLCIG